MNAQEAGDISSPETIDIDTQIGRVALDIDGQPKDETTVTIFIFMKKLPKLFKALMPDSGNFKVDMPRDLVRRYGQKLLDLADG